MTKGSSHRVVMIVSGGSNPFEMGVATELFGLRRPELPVPWYAFELCAATPAVRMHAGFFQLSAAAIVVMLFIVLVANSAAIVLRNRFERKRG